MRSLVVTETVIRRAAKRTLVTGVWLLARMSQLMTTKTTRTRAAIVALVADKWPLAIVDHHVAFQMATLKASVATLVAGKWSHTRVFLLVDTEIVRKRSTKITPRCVACKRFLARVCQQVAFEMAAFAAAIVALVAGKRLLARVSPLVLVEIAVRGAAIITLVAGKWLLARVPHPMVAEFAVRDAAKVAQVAGKRLVQLHAETNTTFRFTGHLGALGGDGGAGRGCAATGCTLGHRDPQ
jgi:hypothetical protein